MGASSELIQFCIRNTPYPDHSAFTMIFATVRVQARAEKEVIAGLVLRRGGWVGGAVQQPRQAAERDIDDENDGEG